MTNAKKIKLYETVLNDLACWDEVGPYDDAKLGRVDEPGAAKAAREVLRKTGGDDWKGLYERATS